MQMQEKNIPDEQLLIRYLLGSLPDHQAEPLDASSVSDEDFAARLSVVEHDLVDAYVRDELRGDTLERFEAWYLSSPARRQKVAFARALLALPRRDTTSDQPALPPPARFATSGKGRFPAWALVAASLVIILTSGYLVVAGLGLRHETNPGVTEQVAVEPQSPVAQTEPPPQQTASTDTTPQVLPPDLPGETQTIAMSVLLLPQTRGSATLPAIPIAAGADQVGARLQLEFDDFPRYEVALRDPATDRILWRSEPLRAISEGERRVVPVRLPAALLEPGNYSLELAGGPADGTTEFIGNYVFRAVIE